MANMTFKASLLPNSDLGYSLGSSDKRWKIYGSLQDPNLSTSNMFPGFNNYNSGSFTFDNASQIYTITSAVTTSTWGSGVSIASTATSGFRVPWNSSYRISMEVYVETAHTITVDFNNYACSGSSWSGNDNDGGGRTTNIFSIPAATWTKISWGTSNKHTGNTNQVPIYIVDGIGLNTGNDEASVVWKIRKVHMQLGDTVSTFSPYQLAIKSISRNNNTFTATRFDGTTFTWDQNSTAATANSVAWANVTGKPTVSSPSASGTEISFIDTVSQSAGTISATRKTVRDASATQSGIVSITDQTFKGNKSIIGGLEIKGHIAGDANSTGHGLWSGGGYHNAYNNIILHGNASTGSSGIAFVSDKVAADGTITTINQPSDRAFIQWHACGVTTYTAENTNPTLGTSGEANKLIIGVGNDANDEVRLQTPGRTGLLHQVGATAYVIPDTGNTTGTVGSSTRPVYINSGAITQTGTSLDVSITGNAATATNIAWTGVTGKPTVNSPSASGTEISFIDTVSQTDGTISATKKTVRDASTSQSGVVSTSAQSFAGNKTFSGEIIAGTRVSTSTPSSETAVNRITITPYFHTGGPWYIKSADDTSNAYLKLYYGSSELIKIKHDGTFINSLKASITGNAATATKLNSTGTTGQFWRGDNIWSNDIVGTLLTDGLTVNGVITMQPSNSSDANPTIFTEHSLNETTQTHLIFKVSDDADDGFIFRNRYWDNSTDTDTLTIDYNGIYIYPTTRPTRDNTINLGTSSYRWANIYGTTIHGALDGNATTATKLGTSNIGNKEIPIYLSSGTATAADGFNVGGNLLPREYLNASNCTLVSYDGLSRTFTLTAPTATSGRCGLSITNTKVYIPWGEYLIVSCEIWSPIAATWSYDENTSLENNTASIGGNDFYTNHTGSAGAIPAETWTKVWYRHANNRTPDSTGNSNTLPDKRGIFEFSNFGIACTANTPGIQFKIRNVMAYYGSDTGAKFNYSPVAAITNISRSGTTFTATRVDGSTFTFTQQDNNSLTGVKGNNESSYRTGNVNLTPANVLGTGTTGQFWRGDNSWSNILTAGLNISGGDLNLYTASADSPDVVWWYANKGKEQARIWMGSGGSTKWAPLYRCYNSDGTSLYSGSLVLGDGTGASGTWGISITGNAGSATKLQTARTISLTGSVTGSTTFDGSGNVSITTTTNHNHDSVYVKKSGDTMTGMLINTFSDNSTARHFTNLAFYENNGSSYTGTIKIKLPNTTSNCVMMMCRIMIFDYNSNSGCDLLVSGYTYSDGKWYNYAACPQGTFTKGVRLAYDGTNYCILLGTTGSTWNYSKIILADVWSGYQLQPSTGYSISLITSESGYTVTASLTTHLRAGQIWGAVWNDYAEYRKDNLKEIQEPGRCVHEVGDGTLALTTKRLERGCEIISDTFGFAIGQDKENGYNTPIASNGRVLAYPYESTEEFKNHIGWPVCSGPNGTVSIMTEEEEEKYSSRIIGTISEIPTYETWGTGNVKVDGRIWIRIK